MKNICKNTGNRGGQYNNNNAEKWTEEEALKLGNRILNWIRQQKVNNVFLSQFLYIENDYPFDVLNYLSGKYKSFSVLIKKAKKIQETKIRLGYLGSNNTALAIFCLKNNHGYRDKREVEHEVNGGKEIKVSVHTETLNAKSKRSPD